MSTLVAEVEKVDCGNYYLSVRELNELADKYGDAVINDSIAMFKAGFIKGQRAERARQKKKRQSLNFGE